MSNRTRINFYKTILNYSFKRFKKSDYYTRAISLGLTEVEFSYNTEQKFGEAGLHELTLNVHIDENGDLTALKSTFYADVKFLMFFDKVNDKNVEIHITSLIGLDRLYNEEVSVLIHDNIYFDLGAASNIMLRSNLDFNMYTDSNYASLLQKNLQKFTDAGIVLSGNLFMYIVDGSKFCSLETAKSVLYTVCDLLTVYNKLDFVELNFVTALDSSMAGFLVSNSERCTLTDTILGVLQSEYDYFSNLHLNTEISITLYDIRLQNYDLNDLISFLEQFESHTNIILSYYIGTTGWGGKSRKISLLEYLRHYRREQSYYLSDVSKVTVVKL